MFLGHFGLGLAAKKFNGRPSLGTYFLAGQFIDLLWPLLLVTGVEVVEVEAGNTAFTPLNFISYPYSHSLAAVWAWALLFAVVYFLLKKDKRSAILLGVLVLSHWVLDLLMHRPDLQLSPWTNDKYGFGLWNNIVATILLEIFVFAVGVYLYLTSSTPKNNVGKFAFWGFVVFMLLVYFMNAFGPPPSSGKAMGYVGFSQWLLIAWGYWIDRNRRDIPIDEKRLFLRQIE